jgi:hypothetical protein
MCNGRKLDSDEGVRFNPVESGGRRSRPCAEQDQAVDFSEYEVCGQHLHTPTDCLTEQTLGFGVVLVACGEERDPAAAIDEDAFACFDAPSSRMWLAFRQRRSP